MLKDGVDVREATHVKLRDGSIEKITSKWGVHSQALSSPSEGGFGVTTESGKSVSMWDARSYLRGE